MNAVYYSLLLQHNGSDQKRIFQFVESLRSLRRFNTSLPVYLHLISELPESALERELAETYHLQIVRFLNYPSLFAPWLPGLGEVLSLYPVLHKYLTLPVLLQRPFRRLLYLDNDTFFHQDPELLFARYPNAVLAAREEPFSRNSLLGYSADGLDQDQYSELAQPASALAPFNTGVVLWERLALEGLAAAMGDFLSTLVSLLKSLVTSPSQSFEGQFFRALGLRLSELVPTTPVLTFPGRRYWIVEQVALWLTLSRLGLPLQLMTPSDVLQGGEEIHFQGRFQRPVVSHYFSNNTAVFFSHKDTGIYGESGQGP